MYFLKIILLKMPFREFLIWSALYAAVSVSYRVGSSKYPESEWKVFFENFCVQVNRFTDMIPMSFILGFYVSIVVGRWWQQFMNIPWPGEWRAFFEFEFRTILF